MDMKPHWSQFKYRMDLKPHWSQFKYRMDMKPQWSQFKYGMDLKPHWRHNLNIQRWEKTADLLFVADLLSRIFHTFHVYLNPNRAK